MIPSRLRRLYQYAAVALIVTIHCAHARIGGYSHRNTTAATPRTTPAMVVRQEPVVVHEAVQQPEEHAPAVLKPTAMLPEPLATAVVSRRTQLPAPPTADNIYELMSLLESQNKQLREQIAMLERESHILMGRNRSLRTDKRRLQRKKRKLAERIDTLEEQILKAASRPPRLTDGKPARYSQRARRK